MTYAIADLARHGIRKVGRGHTKDGQKISSAEIATLLGKDIPNIGLANAPRLTNLKKAGVIERGERGWVQLTELGRAMFLATV